ncbi:MAG: hypothetical protein EHM33_08690 [Chloroflexi bacterium]|nr:MAG: hypothetical protein EHM33_08690 [Chloroflexota bacterium]
MNSFVKRFVEKPIFILLAINILVGLFVFRDYGFSWDEPLFYDYGDALGYAYSPREWFSGNFDISNSYGASGDDHKTRGPAYLLLAREPVHLLEALGLDPASAWHLINFLFFQLGVTFLYRLAGRWMRSSAALAAAALFSWQPLLWGHAFINPKDPPFLVFFLASVCLGFEMADSLADESKNNRQKVFRLILPAIMLGITTSIRVLGPLAGLLVVIYAIAKFGKRITSLIPHLLLYSVLAILAMFITWPFLWENPLTNFVEVSRFMSDNPTNLSVLFGGEIYRAGELPRRYLPFMLATTLTEPVWLLFFTGIVIGYRKLGRRRTNVAAGPFQGLATLRRKDVVALTLVLLWLVILIAYVLLRRPAMYDGLRHFLFILPPIFIFAGFALEFLIERIPPFWLRAGLMLIFLLPGIAGIIQLHPYEYTYYNSFVGGTSGAFRRYETDYWLTCYKEAMGSLDQTINQPIDLYVHREAYVAAYYADENISVHDLRGALAEVTSGDYVLVNTRTNEDRRVFKDVPPILQIGRADAIFCMIKQIP